MKGFLNIRKANKYIGNAKTFMKKQVCTFEHIWFFTLSCVAVFAYSLYMVDNYIVPKWCFSGLILLIGIIILSLKRILRRPIKWNALFCSYIISFVCFLQAIYGIMQWCQLLPSNGIYTVVGSFDNPAGFTSCLCSGFPFVLQCLYVSKEKVWRLVMKFAILAIIIAVCLSESRTGIISISVLVVISLFLRFRIASKCQQILLICMLLLFLGGSYFLKKDSADGRLLIWRCSWEMVKDAPIWGHGTGSFLRYYMNYQADYFEKYPNSYFTMLADSVQSPFNEYLSLILDFGFIGFGILIIVFVFLLYAYYCSIDRGKNTVLLSIIGIGVFAFFSYPLTYPFVWIIIIYSICVLFKEFFHRFSNTTIISFLSYVTFLFSIILLFPLCQRINAEYRWNGAYVNKQLSEYDQLMPVLGRDSYFLYNYAVELYDAPYVDKSYKIALLCRRKWCCYDIELLLGDICMSKENFSNARLHYLKASLMCPNRFFPLYQLFNLYKRIGDEEKAYTMAQLIEEKDVKVPSVVVRQIKYKIRCYMKSIKKGGSKNRFK